jgi:hypothetical protein
MASSEKWVAVEKKRLDVLLKIARSEEWTPLGDLAHLISCRACRASWYNHDLKGHPDAPCTLRDIKIVPLPKKPGK